MTPAVQRSFSPPPVGDRAEAELLIQHLTDVMDALLAALEQETELVRAGRLSEASKLEASKTELSQLYVADTARLKASQPYLAKNLADVLNALRKRHEAFQAVLQMNLTVLATAHAVSESIMRGVSNELARKAMPHGYGSTGHSARPAANSTQPLTVSRVL
jgi:hypothetical protein